MNNDNLLYKVVIRVFWGLFYEKRKKVKENFKFKTI